MPASYQAFAKTSPNALTKETLALYIIAVQYKIVHSISDEFRVVETELLIKLGRYITGGSPEIRQNSFQPGIKHCSHTQACAHTL